MSTALVARPLDAEAFAPYGTVLERPQRPHDAEGPGWRWWAETAALADTGSAYGIGFLTLEPAPLQFDWAERHARSPEMIVVLFGDCLVYGVAKAHDLPLLYKGGDFRLTDIRAAL